MNQQTLSLADQQYRDERFSRVLNGLSTIHRMRRAAGPWVLALPREDLDPTSKTRFDASAHVTYEINKKVDQVACMHVLSVGPGRIRLGYREHIPVKPGDLCLVNLREAGHWISLGFPWGVETLYLFTGDVPFARIYRTSKPLEAPRQDDLETDEGYKARRVAWSDQLFWNIRDVLGDYVLLGRDPNSEKEMRHGEGTKLVVPGTALTDGSASDNQRNNRFPIVYRRVLGVGPGRMMTRESDLGIVEREETKSEAQPGDMMAMCKTVAAAAFMFQGMPLEAIHAASVLVYDGPPSSDWRGVAPSTSVEVHESVPQPIPWDEPSDEDDQQVLAEEAEAEEAALAEQNPFAGP
jgi:hypothetical protein